MGPSDLFPGNLELELKTSPKYEFGNKGSHSLSAINTGNKEANPECETSTSHLTQFLQKVNFTRNREQGVEAVLD